MIINSVTFRKHYFTHVYTVGFESYNNSFEDFFDRVLSPIFRGGSSLEDKSLQKLTENVLKKPPFNAGFGVYLY